MQWELLSKKKKKKKDLNFISLIGLSVALITQNNIFFCNSSDHFDQIFLPQLTDLTII